MQTYCEGALAVGGSAALGTAGYGYDIGAAGKADYQYVAIGTYSNPQNYPTFLLGGKISDESTAIRVYAGSMMIKKGYREEFTKKSFHIETKSLLYENDENIDAFFIYVKEKITALGDFLVEEAEAAIPLAKLKTLNKVQHENYLAKINGKKILIFNITADTSGIINISEINFDDFINEYDMVVIESSARKVTFSAGAILYKGAIVNTSLPAIYDGNKLVSRLSSKILFSFPNALEIKLTGYGITGSVIAPNADVEGSGGSIGGLLVAKNFKGKNGMWLHGFKIPLGEDLWKLYETYGSAVIHKSDLQTGAGLAGAVFGLYRFETNTNQYTKISDHIVTAQNGKAEITKLPPGEYKIVELKAPGKYSLPETNGWIFNIGKNNKGDGITMESIYIKNTLAKGDAVFLKLDLEEQTVGLPGAEFALYSYNAGKESYELVAKDLQTDENGMLKLEDLLPGQYKLVETAPPAGYYLPDGAVTEFEIKLDEDNNPEKFETVEIYNQKLAAVTIFKTDYENPEISLEGAKFLLYKRNSDSEIYEEYQSGLVTDQLGRIMVTGLEPGDYRLKEVAAPAGYYLPVNGQTDFSVVVDSDNRLVKVQDIEISNKLLGKVQIFKVDAENESIMLEGAVFTLYRLNPETEDYEELRTGLRTGQNGSLTIENLEPGSYKLIETKSPGGYMLADATETLFTITV